VTRRSGDQVLVRRAALRIGAQVTALMGATLLVVLATVTLLVLREQGRETDHLLRATAATADDVSDPPAGFWIALTEHGTRHLSPGTPQLLADRLERMTSGLREFGLAGTEYRVLTATRPGGDLVQVAVDLAPQHAEHDRLLRVMAGAAGASLGAAAALGVLLGRRAVRPLADALSLQRAFVADASHELRTPLTLLSTRVQVLAADLRRGDLPAQATQDLAGVVSDVQRLGDVVEDLLVAADPHAEDLHAEVDLSGLVHDLTRSTTAHAAAREVAITATTPGPVVVHGAAAALRRAVLALVDNAVDHTPPGGRVELTVRSTARSAVVSVHDTGPGIDPEAAATVVRRFHSGGQRSGRAHYGLGLALTHDVAARHGGQLRLAPSARGTTFELVLPL
jgi:signal transduction histidine kinase